MIKIEKMMLKKGVEPIIATILLVVVAVILITIILAWGKDFTLGSLSKTNNAVDTKCKDAQLKIENCVVGLDGNITFHLSNISQYYSFSKTDILKIMVHNNKDYESEKTLEYAVEWKGLEPGALTVAKHSPNQEDINTMPMDTTLTIIVRSTECPQTSTTYLNCHK